MTTEQREGRIVAVCSSPNHGYPTYPQDEVIVGLLGIEGDAHSGELRESFRQPGTLKPNDRPISIVSDEVRREMNARFGTNIQPGGFNEQVLVTGLGDLSDVEIGDRVTFDGGVTLEVTDNAFPCDKLTGFHSEPGLLKSLVKKSEGTHRSRRGILTKVLEVGTLVPGERVTLYSLNER